MYLHAGLEARLLGAEHPWRGADAATRVAAARAFRADARAALQRSVGQAVRFAVDDLAGRAGLAQHGRARVDLGHAAAGLRRVVPDVAGFAGAEHLADAQPA